MRIQIYYYIFSMSCSDETTDIQAQIHRSMNPRTLALNVFVANVVLSAQLFFIASSKLKMIDK